MNTEFDLFLKESGIVSQLTPITTPQWNWVAKSRNETLLDMVYSILSYMDLPISLLGYMLLTAPQILNRNHSKSVPRTSNDIWSGREKTKF